MINMKSIGETKIVKLKMCDSAVNLQIRRNDQGIVEITALNICEPSTDMVDSLTLKMSPQALEKEKIAKKYIAEHYARYAEYVLPSNGQCFGDRCRPDLAFKINAGMYVFVEIDEHKHAGYHKELEVARMLSIYKSVDRCLFIRYNPDTKAGMKDTCGPEYIVAILNIADKLMVNVGFIAIYLNYESARPIIIRRIANETDYREMSDTFSAEIIANIYEQIT